MRSPWSLISLDQHVCLHFDWSALSHESLRLEHLLCPMSRLFPFPPILSPPFPHLLYFSRSELMLSGGARESRDNVSGLPIILNKGIMGWRSTNPSIHLSSRDSIPDQAHHHTQTLHISISYLIIKEKHFVIRHPARFLYLGEVLLLVPGKDLHMVEVLNRALVTRLYVKLLEEGVCQVWGVGPRSCSKQKRRRERFSGVKNTGNVAVEGERLAPSFQSCQPRSL